MMWFLGLICGLVIGGILHGGEGAIAGAVLGLFAGAVADRWRGDRQRAGQGGSIHSDSERIRLLEQQIDWLYRETQALRRELGERNASVQSGGPADASPAQAAAAVPDIASMSGAGMPAAMPTAARMAVGSTTADADVAAGPADEEDAASPAALPGSGDLQPAALRQSEAAATRLPDADARAAEVPPNEGPESHAAPATAPGLWARILAGNPLAKIGVVLLFFGVASAFRLAAQYGLFPPSLRLLLAAVAGVAMIAFGLLRTRPADDEDVAVPHRTFGLALQGGGFAVLYLVVYFMLARYAMLGALPAFALFGALGVVCVVLAARQDGPALAVLGLSGAFLAPLMAGGDTATPLPLFLYFTLLNVFILAVDWFRAWRVLNIAGFVFTLAVGMAWAIASYRPEHYVLTQGFLIVFLLLYSATPVATALLRAPGAAAWREGMLIFGTPLAGGFLQMPLMRDVDLGLAWSCFVGALYYFALWALMFRRGTDAVRMLERSHLGIALALLTLTIPLAFDAQVTSAFWAVEGAAVLWFGVREQRRLAQGTGLAMQAAAGAAFIHAWPQLGHALPVLNDVALGGGLIAIAGLVCAGLLRRLEAAGEIVLPPLLPALWALAWWLAVGLSEIRHFAEFARQAPYALLYVTATVVVLDLFGARRQWPLLRATALLLLPVLWLAALLAVDRGHHPLAGLMLIALPLAFVAHYVLLDRHERAFSAADLPAVLGQTARHLGAWWLAIFVVALELGWLAGKLAPGVSLWPLLAWGIAPAAGLALVHFAVRGRDPGLRPWAALPAAYLGAGAWPLLAVIVIWSLLANIRHAGGGSGLPYLPILNPFDLVQLAALSVLVRHAAHTAGGVSITLRRLASGLAFFWLTALAARIAYHWGGVRFSVEAMMASGLFQMLVTLLWTVTAIATMILAARAARRTRWFAGFGLLAVVGAKLLLVDLANAGTAMWTASLIGVALLVLAAGYFAPVPPKDAAEPEGDST